MSLTVNHSQGSYPIEFAPAADLTELLAPCAAVITDKNVVEHQGARLPNVPTLAIEPGEKSKSLAQYGAALEWLARQGVKRSDRIAAVGGGVVGDLAGFLAATYLRGIPYLQVPTSLLAMVDSSVGGKVGIDLEAGKNLAGAFHPPAAVYVAVETLDTLPPRHLRNGIAEAWKAAFIADAGLVPILEGTIEETLIRRCIEIKKEVVEADEFETLGRRAILNFGHTIGHAVEAAAGYESLLHGEAIAIGMVAESRLGEQLAITPVGTADFIEAKLTKAGLPTQLPSQNADRLLSYMWRDKKRAGDKLAFSLLTGIGECKLFVDVEESAVRAVLEMA